MQDSTYNSVLFLKEMANHDLKTEVLGGIHSEEITISEENKVKQVEIINLSNRIHRKAESPSKCNVQAIGLYEEEDDFSLVLEDSSNGSSSPSKTIIDDTIYEFQIGQEIEDLIGLDDGCRKRSVSIDDKEVEVKKPKLKKPRSLMESSPSIFKIPVQKNTENEIKWNKLDDTTQECKTLDVEDYHVQDRSKEIKEEILKRIFKRKSLKENNFTYTRTSTSVERSLLDGEENKTYDLEKTRLIASSRSDSAKSHCRNNDVTSLTVSPQLLKDNVTPEVSTPNDNYQQINTHSTCSKSASLVKEVIETSFKKDEPSLFTTSLSKQNLFHILANDTISNCKGSDIKSKDKILNCTVLEEINICDGNMKNENSSRTDGSVTATESPIMNDLSSVKNKEISKLTETTESENKIAELTEKTSINKELSFLINKLEKSIFKSKHEQVQEDRNNTEPKKNTNLNFAVNRFFEQARFHTEKKVTILKKFNKDQLKKLKRSELEDIVLSKICEVVDYKSNIDKVRSRIQNLEEMNNTMRLKFQNIEKQNRDLQNIIKHSLVGLKHFKQKKQNHVPIPKKVTRQVGLQVLLVSKQQQMVHNFRPSKPPPALALPVFRTGDHMIPMKNSPQVAVTTSNNTTPTAVVTQVPSTSRLHPQPPENKHPIPLPTAHVVISKPELGAPPPKPKLKIFKTPEDIVSGRSGLMLSWNMSLTKDMAEIQSYQMYAYREDNQPPSTGLWKKLGDIKALALPMACMLTQYVKGEKYHITIRAVDIHGRVGPCSTKISFMVKDKE